MGPDSLQFLPTPDPTETATSYEGSVMRVTALKQLDSLLGLGVAGGGACPRDFVPNLFPYTWSHSISFASQEHRVSLSLSTR